MGPSRGAQLSAGMRQLRPCRGGEFLCVVPKYQSHCNGHCLTCAGLRDLCWPCPADELWRHLANLGVDKDDQDAGTSFGKHPTKLLEGMEHNR